MKQHRLLVVAGILLFAGAGLAGDSLNCRMVANWPFGPSLATECDPARNLAFFQAMVAEFKA